MTNYKYPLVLDTISNQEIDSLCEWLRTYPRLTKGDKTEIFENKWSESLGVKYSVYVNSGSSAIMLMLGALIAKGSLKKGDKVVVPSISWATDLSSVMHLGLEPVLCDCNMEDLSVDLDHLKEVITQHDPRALLLVSVLGLAPDMKKIQEICLNNNIILLEDACESIGTKSRGNNLGTFGDMSCFSFYYGHHISTIEGGIVSTNNDELANILKSIRNHGWDRDWPEDYKRQMRKKFNISDFDSLYTFYYPGFNVRSTDLQAFLGITQIDKIESVSLTREKNFKHYLKHMPEGVWLPTYRQQDFISNFAYPVILPNREKVVSSLVEKGVECRPLICGSMGKQPMYTSVYGVESHTNSDIIDRNGFYVPNNPEMTEEQVYEICNIIKESL